MGALCSHLLGASPEERLASFQRFGRAMRASGLTMHQATSSLREFSRALARSTQAPLQSGRPYRL